MHRSRRLAVAVVLVSLLVAAAGAGLAVRSEHPDGGGGGPAARSEAPGARGAGRTGGRWDAVALGDSLATGFGAARGYVPRYRDHLEADTGSSVKLRNLAEAGATSADLLEALESDPAVRRAVQQADVVTWDIGGNDLRQARAAYHRGACGGGDGQACLRRTVAAFKTNWDGILAELLALTAPSPTLLRTMDVYNPYVNEDELHGSRRTLEPYLDDVNAHIAATTSEHGVPYAPVHAAFNGPDGDQDPGDKGLLAGDGLHPNGTGHAVIAELLRGLGYAPLR
jgi:lysophospholipase L1-like esterase